MSSTTLNASMIESSNVVSAIEHRNATAPTLYIEVGGIRYAYRRYGLQTGIPIVLLQHFRGTMDDWDPLVTDGLAAQRTVILFDNAGVGLSGGQTPGSVTAMAEDAVAFIEALGLKQVDLLAFSLGGFVAQQVLLTRPDLVRRAILAGTGPQGGSGMQEYTPAVMEAASRFPLTGTEKEVLFFAPSDTSQKAGADFIARTQLRVQDCDEAASFQSMQGQASAIGEWGAASNEEYMARVATITHPILVVNGTKDIMVPSVNTIQLAQSLPNAELIMYPDAGHGAIFQYAEQFVAHANLFLN